MRLDRFKDAIREQVLSILAERSDIDFKALYAARVVKQDGQQLEVLFDDERLRSKAGIPLRPATPGQVPVFANGTRVLVGWIDGKEEAPYIVGVWLGNGGLVSLTETFSERRTWVGPLVEFKDVNGGGGGVKVRGSAAPLLDVGGDGLYSGSLTVTEDVTRRHDLSGGDAPSVSAGSNVTVNSTDGADRCFTVNFSVGMGGTTGNLFIATFDTAYDAAPMVIACLKSSSAGAPKLGGYESTTTTTTIKAGELWPQGDYSVTVMTSG